MGLPTVNESGTAMIGAASSGLDVQRCSLAHALLRDGTSELARLRVVRGAYARTARRMKHAIARITLAGALLGLPMAGAAWADDPVFRGPVNAFGLDQVAGEDSAPAFADIDGDGDLDALVGSSSGDVTFFENTGTADAPAFDAPSVLPFGLTDVGSDSAPSFVDIDADGDLDAFVGRSDGNTSFFSNTGTAVAPAFGAASTNPFGLADVGSGSVPNLVDIDDDGDLDALIGSSTTGTVYFQNTGTAAAPAFAAPLTNPFGLASVGGADQHPAFADIDGDGDFDALVGRNNGLTSLFTNTGTAAAPAFAAAVSNPFGFSDLGYHTKPELADIDGDGDLDLFLGDYDGTTNFFENTGSATVPSFESRIDPFGLEVEDDYAAPAFGDIDGDGDLDALVGSYSYSTFRENTGTASAPAFAPPEEEAFGFSSTEFYTQPTFVDIDGDGDLDIFEGEEFGYFYFWENTGTPAAPAFAPATQNPFGLSREFGDYYSIDFSAPAFVDIDGDGDFDLFSGTKELGIVFFENTGSDTAPEFAEAVADPFGLTYIAYFPNPTAVDIDGDGDFDLFVGNEEGHTYFFRNTGTANAPAFDAPLTNPFGLGNVGEAAAPVFADIDGDGRLEAFIGSYRGNIMLFAQPVPEGPTRPLEIGKATVRVAPAANGLITVKGTLEAEEVDVSAGFTVIVTDGNSVNETGSIDAADCDVKNNGKIKCVHRDAVVSKKKVKAQFVPSKKNPGEYSFKIFLNKLDLATPLAAPVTLTIEEGAGGDPFEGSNGSCVVQLTKLVCKD